MSLKDASESISHHSLMLLLTTAKSPALNSLTTVYSKADKLQLRIRSRGNCKNVGSSLLTAVEPAPPGTLTAWPWASSRRVRAMSRCAGEVVERRCLSDRRASRQASSISQRPSWSSSFGTEVNMSRWSK